MRSYAVAWREADEPVKVGKLQLGRTRLRLESGVRRSRVSTQSLRYEDIASVEATRSPGERIDGRPTVVVRRSGRAPLAIAAVEGLGSIHELVELLAGALAGVERP